MAEKLTTKQELFISAYLGPANGNATEAARRAGYRNPRQMGYENLTKHDIASKIAEKVDEAGATAADVLRELTSVAMADWKDFVRVTGRAKDGEATGVQSDIGSKVKALELLGKYHQLFVEKAQLDVNVRQHRVIGVPEDELARMFQPAESIGMDA